MKNPGALASQFKIRFSPLHSGTSMSERRNYERHLLRRLALLKFANGEIVEGHTVDMSVGGAFIEIDGDIELHEGDTCSISLVLEEDDDEMVTTQIYGSISHQSAQGVGCNFLKINSVYYQFLTNIYK